MVKYNKSFTLDIDDINLIETALYENTKTLFEKISLENMNATAVCEVETEIKKINNLLGKIHNQKRWYRPKGTYISG